MSADHFESWLLALLVRGVAIAAVWWAVSIVMRGISADRIAAWWRSGVLALMIVGFFPSSAVRWWISIPRSAPPPAGGLESATVLSSRELPTSGFPPLQMAAKSLASPISWWTCVWILGAVAFSVRLIASHRRVSSLIRSSALVSDPQMAELLRVECLHAGIARTVAIKSHPGIETPFTAGCLRPVIVIPAALEQHDGAALGLILRHELAHVSRYDVLWQILAELILILHWPNPLAWSLHLRLRLAQEAAADDVVLSRGTDGPAYADFLLSMARSGLHLPDSPCLAPMARVSSLRRRVSLILDESRRRNVLGPPARTVLLVASGAAALALSLTGLRAQVAAPASPVPSPDESWSRSYRDTFRLERAFGERFPGTSGEALIAFRKELGAVGVPLGESIKFELSPDKGTLHIEFSDRDRRLVEYNFAEAISRAGWWRDATQMLRKEYEGKVSLVREEIARQEKAVATAAVNMAKIRQSESIIDPDPESSDAVISTPDRNLTRVETQRRELQLRISALEDQGKRLDQSRPQMMTEILRMLQIEDATIVKIQAAWQEAVTEDMNFERNGVSKEASKRKQLRARIDVLEKMLSDTLASLKANNAAQLTMERARLAQLEAEFKSASEKQIQDKSRAGRYLEAKAEYLQNKKIFEAAQLKYSVEMIELQIDQPQPLPR